MEHFIRRRIYDSLLAWKASSARKPLVLFGARQVGKTFTLKEFGSSEFADTAYVDFSRDTAAAGIFDASLDPRTIVEQLESLLRMSIDPEGTLIVFDEVQLCERAITSLKYFCENAPEYHVIAAGSLLGVKVNRERYSFPVGKVDVLVQHPLDFEEYLWARGDGDLASLIREALSGNTPFGLHEHALAIWREYCLVGGMPEAVSAFVDSGDSLESRLGNVRRVQALIEQGYVADMTKYARAAEAPRIFEAWRSLPGQLAKENRKFQYSKVRKGGRASQYETAVEWLGAAGVVSRCVQVSEGVAPLRTFENPDFFKLYYADTGLLSASFDAHPTDLMPKDDKASRFRGAVAENYCMQQFSAGGVSLRYWGVQSRSEVELVARLKTGGVVPVEVKSGSNVRSNSLQAYRSAYKPPYLARVSAKNFGFENGIRSVPIYAARFFAEEFEAMPLEQIAFGV